MNITFREMKQNDVAETIELCNICFEEETSLEEAQKSYELHKNDTGNLYIIGLTEDGHTVAHVRIQFNEHIHIYERKDS